MLVDFWVNDIKASDLKLEKAEQIFQSLMPLFQKAPKAIIMISSP